jgi:hypothetical protein
MAEHARDLADQLDFGRQCRPRQPRTIVVLQWGAGSRPLVIERSRRGP